MKEFKNNKQKLDDCFKQLGDFEVPPSNRGNTEPEAQDSHPIDESLQSYFSDFEESPRPELWQNIEKDLPLHPVWKKQLVWLSRIAAVLILGLLLSVLMNPSSDSASIVVIENEEDQLEYLGDGQSHSVFDLREQKNLEDAKASKTLFGNEEEYVKDQIQSEIEQLNKLGEIGNLESLPISVKSQLDSPFAAIAEKSKLQEEPAEILEDHPITISIPLLVVPSHEVDDILDQYNNEVIMANKGLVNPAQ